MKDVKESAHMSGWIAAFTLMGGILIRVVWSNDSLTELACGEKDIHCFRDWVSALGGWAAVAAAVPTVLYLSKQFRQAQMQHRDRLTIDLTQTIALADNGADCANEIIDWYYGVEMLENTFKGPLPLHVIDQRLDRISKTLQLATFDRIESEIEFPRSYTIRFLREYLESMTNRNALFFNGHHQMTDDDRARLDGDFQSLREAAKWYAQEVEKISVRYRTRYNQLLATYSN
jgi:hypothetical protein